MKGLEDAPRSGKPKKYVNLRAQVLKTLEMPPPKGQVVWDGLRLAEKLGAKKSSVYAFLRKDGVQLQRKRSWCVSTDSNFAAKAADIIGLYLQPPARALVLSVDEKPSIQALSRTMGYVQTSSGKIVRGLKSTYRRNGALNLFAALNVATGEISKKTTKTKTRADFQAFMEEVIRNVPVDQAIHVILDNYATHKRNDEWLKAHPNVTFHFTPTSASWLNQIEIWFGILGRKALNGASFNSTEDLAKAIDEFCQVWHEKAHPFVWKKREVRGSQIKNTIANLLD
jgi:transposase